MTPRTPDATPAKPSGKPSVAVLPFDSMSEDPEQESFVDGVTEDIITALSRTRWYDVTARNSTFTYKGKSPDVRDVGKALGVNYVLEGSVRKSGNKMRITVQLIDAATGNHVWADRYDRGADDEFALQDEIARRVSSALNERIWQDVAQNFGQKAAEDYVAYDYAFSGIKLIHKIDPIAVVQAEEYLLKALEFDPDLFPGNLGLGFCKLAT
jgi:TolB-like protein